MRQECHHGTLLRSGSLVHVPYALCGACLSCARAVRRSAWWQTWRPVTASAKSAFWRACGSDPVTRLTCACSRCVGGTGVWHRAALKCTVPNLPSHPPVSLHVFGVSVRLGRCSKTTVVQRGTRCATRTSTVAAHALLADTQFSPCLALYSVTWTSGCRRRRLRLARTSRAGTRGASGCGLRCCNAACRPLYTRCRRHD